MPKNPPAAPAHHTESHEAPAPTGSAPPPVVVSPVAVHLNDRMKLAAKPNGGEPLSHRNRGKAGRKG